MTTVVYDGKTIAADRGTFTGNCIELSNVKKIFKRGDLFISGAGNLADLQEFADTQERKPEFCDSEFIIINSKTGACFHIDQDGRKCKIKPPLVVGSGKDYAIAAVASGLDAIEAVKVAIKLDPYSNNGVQSYTVRK